ncbi:MAG: hypothetical protein MZU95_16190 [Desulfomicrobium escambiense]|nr:hypothetical protein [Desulfomicrobium escambiense]
MDGDVEWMGIARSGALQALIGEEHLEAGDFALEFIGQTLQTGMDQGLGHVRPPRHRSPDAECDLDAVERVHGRAEFAITQQPSRVPRSGCAASDRRPGGCGGRVDARLRGGGGPRAGRFGIRTSLLGWHRNRLHDVGRIGPLGLWRGPRPGAPIFRGDCGAIQSNNGAFATGPFMACGLLGRRRIDLERAPADVR